MGTIVNVVENAVCAVRKNWKEILLGAAVAVVGGVLLGLMMLPFVG